MSDVLPLFQGPLPPASLDRRRWLQGAAAGVAVVSGLVSRPAAARGSADYRVVCSFNGSDAVGQSPTHLWVYPDGSVCGVSSAGGTAGRGTLFRLGADGVPALLHGFAADESGPFGQDAIAAPCIGPDGALYGSTQQGGASGLGLAYRLDMAGNFQRLHEFSGGAVDGRTPYGALVPAADGFLYGISVGSEVAGHEWTRLYRMSLAGEVSALAQVADGGGGLNGLTRGSDARLYSAASLGGPAGLGSAFCVDLAGLVTSLAVARRPGQLLLPTSAWTAATDGNLYATTALSLGGPGGGCVLRMGPGGAMQVLHRFDDPALGRLPTGVIQASDGHLYGIAAQGGVNNAGLVYRLRLDGRFRVLHGFQHPLGPRGSLVEGPGAVLYGLTQFGGPSLGGTVFALALRG